MQGVKEILKNSMIGDKAEQLRFLVFLSLVFSLPFDIIYSAVLFITFIGVVLVSIRKENLKTIPKQVIWFQLIYLLAFAGYFYSLHKNEAAFMLEKQLSILLIPLLLPIAFKINSARSLVIVQVLCFASVIALVYLFVQLFVLIKYELKLPVLSTAFSGTFFNHEFSRPLKIHAGYLSLYVAFSVIYCVYSFNRSNNKNMKLLLGLAIVFLFAGLFFLASRNILIATFIILLFILPMFKIVKRKQYILITTFGLLGTFTVIRSVPYLWERFSKEMISEIKPLEQGDVMSYYSAEPRIDRWKGALNLVKKSPFIGYGTGDEREMLKTEYMRRQLYISYLESFNAHNQYLSYLIKNGFLGLLIFLSAFYYYLRLAIKQNSFIYTAFIVLLLIGFYTENILDANKGILFFSIFNTTMGLTALSELEDSKTAT